jgi:CRP/FNR family cyclic AMP-dependent transcriptional regulator
MARWSPGVALLAEVKLFKGMSKKALQEIYDHMRERTFPAGAAIVEEGDREGSFYLVLEGTARVTVRGERRGTIGPGGYFGEISLIDREPRLATVVAETPLRALTLDNLNFRFLLRDHPEMSHELLIQLCRLLRAERSLHV